MTTYAPVYDCCHDCRRKRLRYADFFEKLSVTMLVCHFCGNKRCPKATDHRNDCTMSNEPGQPGSRY